MDINRANMDALFVSYNTAFTSGMQLAGVKTNPEQLILDEIAMMGSSSGAATVHAWLSQIGGMREWIGDRVIANIESGKLSVVNRDFEKTVAVSRNDIEDDNYGVYTPLVSAMGQSAGALWMTLGIDALAANGKWADGKDFFATDRKMGKATIANKVTTALSADTFKAARIAMESYKLHGDEPAEVTPTTLLVGPGLRDAAWNIVENDFVVGGETNKAGSIKNPNKGTVKLRVSPRLVGTRANYWFLLGEKGGIKPVYVQKRKEPILTRMDKDNDDNVFWKNEYAYGTHARGEAFLTLPHLAYAGLATA
jgi:phage major head subunit gpT-like protein